MWEPATPTAIFVYSGTSRTRWYSILAETGHDPFIPHVSKFGTHSCFPVRHHETYSVDKNFLKKPRNNQQPYQNPNSLRLQCSHEYSFGSAFDFGAWMCTENGLLLQISCSRQPLELPRRREQNFPRRNATLSRFLGTLPPNETKHVQWWVTAITQILSYFLHITYSTYATWSTWRFNCD